LLSQEYDPKPKYAPHRQHVSSRDATGKQKVQRQATRHAANGSLAGPRVEQLVEAAVAARYATPMPRRFQFSLRALLIATALFACTCGWVAHNANIVRQGQAISLGFDGYSGHSSFRIIGAKPFGSEPSIPWFRRALGDWPVEVLFYTPRGDPDGSELRRVRSLFPEAEIYGWPANEDELPPGIKRWPDDRYWMI
jgi:hypothetical protein